MPRTTVVIDNDLLAEAKKVSGIKTTRGVLEEGLREVIRRARIEEILSLMGSGIIDMTLEELLSWRETDLEHE
ncbi:MAG: type II toxin-antitoxin system VapB family antitoxin [Actinobacteria bacterium]|nr:type II toxin-antitoxin system VapB family antitoxin [Actinomycetota bacterium]MBU1943095.1 type II toxin-antitoxin system VapB family antitoxin [Actinomycetota bacterium]MBU2687958.1 type II toxin-antitoxin system VapB family antitoxin [Actinomycetota bacterium]